MAEQFKLPDDYVTVAERIALFIAKYPDGSLDFSWEYQELNGQPLIVGTARAYRSPEDPRPGIGSAWELLPGRTPYTRGSELMNLETSCWGRAIVALGIGAKRGVASAEEIHAAREESPARAQTPARASQAQLTKIEGLLHRAGMRGTEAELDDFISQIAQREIKLTELDKRQASWLIDLLGRELESSDG